MPSSRYRLVLGAAVAVPLVTFATVGGVIFWAVLAFWIVMITIQHSCPVASNNALRWHGLS